MISKEIQEEYKNGLRTKIFHKVHGEGEVSAVRVDHLNGGRLKATIQFPIEDLFEVKTRPEFLFLDDENLSESCQ